MLFYDGAINGTNLPSQIEKKKLFCVCKQLSEYDQPIFHLNVHLLFERHYVENRFTIMDTKQNPHLKLIVTYVVGRFIWLQVVTYQQ